jgi:hypothetical protein
MCRQAIALFRKLWLRAQSRPCAATGRGERDPRREAMHHRVEQGAQDAQRRFKQHLLIVGVELPNGEAATAREPTEGVGEPAG